MEENKETKPLLDKSKSGGAEQEQVKSSEPQPSTSTSTTAPQPPPATKKGQKTKSPSSLTKPNLPSLHEVSSEADETKKGSPAAERRTGVEALEKKRTCPHCIAESLGETGTPIPQPTFFGIRNYLHHFYDTSPQSPNPPVRIARVE